MKQIRTVISEKLKSVHPKVHHLKAPTDAIPPYLVYQVSLQDLGDGLQLMTLDIDGWDTAEDTTALEDLMARVNELFNKKTIITDRLSVSIYTDRMLSITDDDPRINRRKYIFQGRLFER